MLSILSRNWWAFALRGLLAVIFGILALVWPRATLLTLVLIFGAYALVDGIFAVVAGIASYGRSERWWAILLEGLAGIALGLLTLFWPGATSLVLLYFIAAWAILTGIFEIAAAIRLRREITGEWLLILSGALSILFGLVLVFFPGAGALSLIWLIAAYAIVFGLMTILFAFRLRGLREEQGVGRAPGA